MSDVTDKLIDAVVTVARHETYKAEHFPLPYLEITPTTFRYVDEKGYTDINPVIASMFDLKRIRDMFSTNNSITGTRRAICEVFNLHTAPFYHCTLNAVAVAIDGCQWLGWDWTKILKDQQALKKHYFEKHGLTDDIVGLNPKGSDTMLTQRIEYIASHVHETNRQFCIKHNHFVDAKWNDLSEERRESTRNAVRNQLDNPAPSPEVSHQRWMEQRTAEGWVYGEVKDPEAKTHPCLVPYDKLPAEQQEKDGLFAKSVAGYAFAFDHAEAE